MRITFIGHSGFLVETGTANFIFDYYTGVVPVLSPSLPLAVFASHRHKDHYNPEIFEWMDRYPDILYILDRNCGIKWKLREFEERGIPFQEHVIRVRKNTSCEIMLKNNQLLSLEMLRSTDTGVAFLLRYEGYVIYHAGDLNCWQWEGEPDFYNMNMEKKFRQEMDKLSGLSIDAAFLPLDPKQQGYMDRGIEIFLQKTDAKIIFPMHMWGQYDKIGQFCERHPEYKDRIVQIHREGETFDLTSTV